MSQDNDTIKRFKKRVDEYKPLTETDNLQMEAVMARGRDAIKKIEDSYKPPARPEPQPQQIHSTTEEVIPVKLDLSLTPEETKQGISQIENSNILNNLLKNPLEYSPKTKLIVAASSLVTLLVTYLSGCF